MKAACKWMHWHVTGRACRCGGNRNPSARITEAKFINKSSLFIQLHGVIRRLELKPNSEQKVEYIFVAQPYCQTACWWQWVHFKYISNQSANALVSSTLPFQSCPAPFLIKSLEGTFNDSNFFMYKLHCSIGIIGSLSP